MIGGYSELVGGKRRRSRQSKNRQQGGRKTKRNRNRKGGNKRQTRTRKR